MTRHSVEKTLNGYSDEFFADQQHGALSSARHLVPIVIELVEPRSVIDVGCGVGAWLSVFSALGVSDLLGVDGDYVDRSGLLIPEEQFLARDLTRWFDVGRRFDLAVCLEVAEHLPAEAARGLVRLLTDLAPVVLFGAAIPGQGGVLHVNEQWPDYWATLFDEHGYLPVDAVRPRVWDIDEVAWWYAQNALLFVKTAELAEAVRRRSSIGDRRSVRALVHPRLYNGLREAYAAETSRQLLSRLPSALRRSIEWHLMRRR